MSRETLGKQPTNQNTVVEVTLTPSYKRQLTNSFRLLHSYPEMQTTVEQDVAGNNYLYPKTFKDSIIKKNKQKKQKEKLHRTVHMLGVSWELISVVHRQT